MPSPRAERIVLALTLLLLASAAGARANLLRNGSFQDDWLTLLPENQNHHWCYATAFQNRRDYNPDGWFLSGSWRWLNADGPRGTRRLILEGPRAEVLQRINWVLIHDDRRREGFPDAGGFPAHAPQTSERALTVVRDLTLRIRVRGENVPSGAASLEVSLAPPGRIAAEDPMGTRMPATASVSKNLPSGTFTWQWVEATLSAAAWLKATQATQPSSTNVSLPGVASVAIRYAGTTGQIEIDRAELAAAEPLAPNLLAQGGFETLDSMGWPEGWSRPSKYRYFPPALYYIFNTWHNATFENRGVVSSDSLLTHAGDRSLKMIVPSGDEVQMVSAPIVVNQTETRLIEVSAWIKTDQLNMLQIDGVSDAGERLDGFNFIHKAPVSIGTDEWREIRQVFKPRRPLRSFRLILAARGVNGYTLGDTGETPQANATGTIWWDDVRVFEPESALTELANRRVATATELRPAEPRPHLLDLDPGERLFGSNTLTATVMNPGRPRTLSVEWRFTTFDGTLSRTQTSALRRFKAGEVATLTVPYDLRGIPLPAYAEHRAEIRLVEETGSVLASSEIRFSTWSQPIDLELGALYLAPERTRQFVRLNLGFASSTMSAVTSVRLDLIRRGSGAVLRSITVAATPADVANQRDRIPMGLREDFTNLVLADVDVSDLPVQPYASPERRWLIRATLLDASGRSIAAQDSQPFCRQAHRSDQGPVASVRLEPGNRLYVNDEPFFPWGAAYGHVPVYDGAQASAPFRDLHNLPPWGLYDGYTANSYKRASSDFNSVRYVAGAIVAPAVLEKAWTDENQLAATAFVSKEPAFSSDTFVKAAGGNAALAATLSFFKNAPMVVSVAPGIEEGFGLFRGATSEQIDGLQRIVDQVRRSTGKPVMVGHGGYWNRFEFERVPFFDIYDPETEPLYPASLQTDLMPLIAGQAKTIWLRPQMYEDVPYERWRFQAYVEMMRGARGFQLAHGPGDASLFRGLGGEMEGLKPVLWSADPGPSVHFSPSIEHWTRRHDGRTYIMAATTHGMTFGDWRWADAVPGPHGRARVTDQGFQFRNEANSYGIGEPNLAGPRLHGIQNLPAPRRYPSGAVLSQWVWLDPQDPPRNLTVLVKADGRFTHAASWGALNPDGWQGSLLEWFLRSFYRHATGFLGWGKPLLEESREYAPPRNTRAGDLPTRGIWTRLEIRLDTIDAQEKLVDGVGFTHEGGRVLWGETSVSAAGAPPDILWGDALQPTAMQLARTRIDVAGLKAGTKIRVLFEDREIVSSDGYFVDDFRGRDLYQRFGGGLNVGYGDAPVALHLYEVPGPAAS